MQIRTKKRGAVRKTFKCLLQRVIVRTTNRNEEKPSRCENVHIQPVPMRKSKKITTLPVLCTTCAMNGTDKRKITMLHFKLTQN